MRYADEFNREGTNVHDIARLNSMQQNITQQLMLFKFAFGQASGEVRTIDRHIEFLE